MIDVIKAIHSMSLLEKKDMSEELIREVLSHRKVLMSIDDVFDVYGKQLALGLADKYPVVSFAFVDAINSCLGVDSQKVNGLRRSSRQTPLGVVEPVTQDYIAQKLHQIKSIEDKYLKALEVLKFFCSELPFEHSNASIGYLCACMYIEEPFYIDDAELAHSAVDAATTGDVSVFESVIRNTNDVVVYSGNIFKVSDIVATVPSSVRAMFETDYECARHFISEYVSRFV